VVKKLKRLIFSRNPVGQEEKQGKARFPLAVLSTASHPTNTLPCGTAKARTRGTGRCRSEAQRKNLSHKQTHQNDTTDGIKTEKNVMHITKYKKQLSCLYFRKNNLPLLCTNFGTCKKKGDNMLQVTSREFRDKQASLLNIADQGEQVVIRRRGKRSYMLTPIYDNDITITPELEQKIERARAEIKAGKCTTLRSHEDIDAYFENL
jgi:antitoxin (DNA-binding transcriptional repressor) of toxin-antitoxin stability system